MPKTSKMQWPYPTENQDPWWEAFEALMASMDASGYASREDRSIVMMEGGTFTFNAGAETITWSSAILVLSPITGLLMSIGVPTSPVELKEGMALYVNLVRAAQSTSNLTALSSYQVPGTDQAYILAMRKNGRVYFRNGVVLNDSTPATVLQDPTTGGSAITAPKQDEHAGTGGATKFDLSVVVPSSKYDGVRVFRQGSRVTKKATPTTINEYRVIEETGVTKVEFGVAPLLSDIIIIDYWV